MRTIWVEDSCPECDEINWICLGEFDNTDPTTLDIDGYRCHVCGEIILFDEETTRLMEGVGGDMPIEEFVENYGNYKDGLEYPD